MGFVDEQGMISSIDTIVGETGRTYLVVILKYEEMHSKNLNHLLQS